MRGIKPLNSVKKLKYVKAFKTKAFKMGLFSFVLIGTLIHGAYAVEKPRALSADARIKVVAYQANNVVPVQGSSMINTQIIFGKNETIINVQSGDAAAWSMDVDKTIPNVLNVKPTILGSKTDLDVITESASGKKRFYRFALTSKPNNSLKNVTYALQFIYPIDAKKRALKALKVHREAQRSILNASQNPKDYNWDYSFHGAREILPLHVFDDGRFTYFELRPNQPVPAIFAVNNPKGQEAVVNFRRIGNTIIVEQTAPQFTLRDGKYLVASVFNNRAIQKIRRYG